MPLASTGVKPESFLQPGDGLLYNSGGLIGWAIKLKTWHQVSHCECYLGGGRSVASRGPQDGKGGVGKWDLRLNDLVSIMRPCVPFNLSAAERWFTTVDGQGYDFLALFRFYAFGPGDPTKMMCSEFLTRWYRAGGLEPFQADEDADMVAPASFLTSPRFDHYIVDDAGLVQLKHLGG